jgi:hypothetical protein
MYCEQYDSDRNFNLYPVDLKWISLLFSYQKSNDIDTLYRVLIRLPAPTKIFNQFSRLHEIVIRPFSCFQIEITNAGGSDNGGD